MKKWLVGIIVLVVIGCAGFYGFTDRELDRMWGRFTAVAEPVLRPAGPSTYVVAGASVLTPDGDQFLAGRDVLIEGGTIAAVAPSLAATANVPVIDGRGMFLMPGFTDSHVHLWESENDLLLYLANGVTSVREMNGTAKTLRWRDQIRAGRPGPNLFVTAPQLATFGLLKGAFVGWTQKKVIVRSRTDVQDALRDFEAAGYDAAKASSFLSAPLYADLGELATQSPLPLLGHIPIAADIDTFFAARHSEVAHVEEITKALDREFGGYTTENADDYLVFVGSRSPGVASRLVANGIAVTSTLFLIDSIAQQRADVGAVLSQVPLAYANPGITEGSVITARGMGWLPGVNIYRAEEDWNDARLAQSVTYWKAYSEAQHIVFNALLAQKVTILAGTDSNVPPMVPGFSLHDEMRALREAGMSAAQVLQSATRAPAVWAGIESGQIRPGYAADIVLLRENPLDDIDATRSIEAVVKRGRFYSRADLDEMLRAVKSANDSSRTVDIATWD